MADLGESCAVAGRRDEGVLLQEQALARNRLILPPDHPFFAGAMESLAANDDLTGREEDTKKLRAELEALSEKHKLSGGLPEAGPILST